MEQKTKIHAEDGKHDLLITRDFDLPLNLLFKAHVEADLVEQWMGTKVLKLRAEKHGSWQFQTTDSQGNVVFGANGVFHKFIPEKTIVRTFEMENSPFPVQLEFFEFEQLSPETSQLRIHIVYKSVYDRDQMLKLPFAQGINMAHNRLQDIATKLK